MIRRGLHTRILALCLAAIGALLRPPAPALAQTGTRYAVTSCPNALFVPGTTDIGNHGDDDVTLISLPFAYVFYGVVYASANVSSNGNLQFASGDSAYENACLPRSYLGPAICAFWDDLHTTNAVGLGQGIFTSVSGTAPNRIFNIEWRAALCCSSDFPDIRFEIRLYEDQQRLDIVYASQASGSGATVGIQDGNSAVTQYSCNQSVLSNGLGLTFYCIDATPTLNYGIAVQCSGATVPPAVFNQGFECDDCAARINFGFNVSFYGNSYSSAIVSSNGTIQFVAGNGSTAYQNDCLPSSQITSPAIFPYWDDLTTELPGNLISAQPLGSAPNRMFDLEFRTSHRDDESDARFGVRLFENQTRIEITYGSLGNHNGDSATVGVQAGSGGPSKMYSCNTASLTSGMRLAFYATGIPNQPPVCSAGGPYAAEVSGGFASILLDGSASHDPDIRPSPITYHWTSDCPGAIFSPSPDMASPMFTRPSGVPATCNVTLTVSDGELMRNCSTTVTSNIPPVCNAGGPYYECNSPTSQIQLIGSGSSDPDNFPAALTYAWSTDCPGATFSPSNTVANPVIQMTQAPPATCHATLTVSDGAHSRSCPVDLNFIDIVPPAITLNPPAAYDMIVSGGAAFVPGTSDIGNHCNDCVNQIVFPFPFTFYGVSYSSAFVTSNGNLQFASTSVRPTNACLPFLFDATYGPLGPAIFAYWDDLRTDIQGVYASVTGVPPNRIFNIEWRAFHIANNSPASFEIRLYENGGRIDLVYGAIAFPTGTSATIGIQDANGRAIQYECNSQTLFQGQQVTFMPRSPDYIVTPTYGAAITPGTADVGNHCNDCINQVALPFPVSLYGISYQTAYVSTNGNLQFTNPIANPFAACLPRPDFGPTIFAHWRDLYTAGAGQGVFTALTGAAPNRVFNIEWRVQNCCNTNPPVHNFEIQLYEGQSRFDVVIHQAQANGLDAVIGVQAGTGQFTEYSCFASTLSPTQRLAFTLDPTAFVECHALYVEPGATATDRCGGNLSNQIVRSGTVNVNVPGIYPLQYNVNDPSGNPAPTVMRNVVVGHLPDLNGDRYVTTADLPLFVNVLLGLDGNPAHVLASDTNCDGVANGADIQGFVNALVP